MTEEQRKKMKGISAKVEDLFNRIDSIQSEVGSLGITGPMRSILMGQLEWASDNLKEAFQNIEQFNNTQE